MTEVRDLFHDVRAAPGVRRLPFPGENVSSQIRDGRPHIGAAQIHHGDRGRPGSHFQDLGARPCAAGGIPYPFADQAVSKEAGDCGGCLGLRDPGLAGNFCGRQWAVPDKRLQLPPPSLVL